MIKYFIEMIKIEKDKDLLKYNSYKINITAKYFVELKIESDYSDIYELFDFIKKEKIKKFFVLGSGANVIFKNNFYDGIIIKLKNNFTI
jgi:UDP-N-acetylmuramate dehydrogenase